MKELAVLYFPNSSARSASCQLRRWMHEEQLAAKLRDAGYHTGQKILTPRQVAILVDHLGEP